jgi:hypothetical protein
MNEMRNKVVGEPLQAHSSLTRPFRHISTSRWEEIELQPIDMSALTLGVSL